MTVVFVGGYKISALDIERELLSLPYIAEAMVVGVSDEEYGERVAAAVVLEGMSDVPPNDCESVTEVLDIEKLRNDLRHRLAGYKLPTALRIVKDEFSKSPTGKVVKKKLGPEYFPGNYRDSPEVQLWRSNGKPEL